MSAAETPAQVLLSIEELVKALASQASQELLEEWLGRLTPAQLKLRMLNLAQMVASNTTSEQRRDWAVTLITQMAQHYSGVDLTEEGQD